MTKQAPWYEDWRGGDRKNPAMARGQWVEDNPPSSRSGEERWNYLLAALRVNAPGYDRQDIMGMAQNLVGVQYLAIHTLTTQAMQAEATLYEVDDRDPDQKIPVSRHDAAYELIERPNDEESFGDIVEQLMLQESLLGTGLLWAPPPKNDRDGAPREMYVIPTASVLPQPISPLHPHGAYLVQPWYPAGPYAQIPSYQSVGATVPAEQVIRVKEPHPLMRWVGYSTMFAIGAQLDTARQIDLARMAAMTKGVDPSIAIEFDPAVKLPTDKDIERMAEQIQQVYGGAENASKAFIVPGGGKVNKLSSEARHMAFQEGWMQLLEFALACWGVNKAVAGMTDGLTYATLFASLKAFYVNTLGPKLHRLAQRYDRGVLHRHHGRSMHLTLSPKKITDETQRNSDAQVLISAEAIKVGELRKMFDLPPCDRDDEWVKSGSKESADATGGLAGGPPKPSGKIEEKKENPLEAVKKLVKGGDDDREDNPEGEGGLGPRKSLHDREEVLGRALERHLTNGAIHH